MPGWLALLRWGLPGAIGAAGLVLLLVADSDPILALGGTLIGVALLVVLANVLFRMGVQGEAEREREEQARREYERTGRWSS